MANFVYTPYRNAVVGKVSDYVISTVMTNFATTLFTYFNDDADAAVAATDVFQSVQTAGETPSFANRLVLGSVTSGVVATGVVDAADAVFTGASVLAAGDPVESYIGFKYITNAAASPNLFHFDTATGLPLTPNGADVTVAFNASGIYKF
jgi:hypothetical protein